MKKYTRQNMISPTVPYISHTTTINVKTYNYYQIKMFATISSRNFFNLENI